MTPDTLSRCVHCPHCRALRAEAVKIASRLSAGEEIHPATLTDAREALRMTGVAIAHALDVAPETVSRWENGKLGIQRQTWLAVLGLLGGA